MADSTFYDPSADPNALPSELGGNSGDWTTNVAEAPVASPSDPTVFSADYSAAGQEPAVATADSGGFSLASVLGPAFALVNSPKRTQTIGGAFSAMGQGALPGWMTTLGKAIGPGGVGGLQSLWDVSGGDPNVGVSPMPPPDYQTQGGSMPFLVPRDAQGHCAPQSRAISKFLPCGCTPRAFVALVKLVGPDAAGAALGMTGVQATQLFFLASSKKRRGRRGVSGRQLANAKRVFHVVTKMYHQLHGRGGHSAPRYAFQRRRRK
jgi:hypothetical protein